MGSRSLASGSLTRAGRMEQMPQVLTLGGEKMAAAGSCVIAIMGQLEVAAAPLSWAPSCVPILLLASL